MPKRKEQADMHIPIKPEDVKISVEVPVKNIPEEQIIRIEKTGKKPERVKKPKIKSESKPESATKPGKGSYILIITEKPQAAAKIAAALSNGKDKRMSGGKGVYYYELERNNKKIIVACAVGHLFSVSQTKKTSGYPVFDIGWKPNFEVRKRDFTRNYYMEIQRLAKNASEIVVASVDYNEKVPIMENRIIKIVKIGEFIDDVLDNKKPISNIKVPCFNKKGKISFKKLKKAIRHKMSEDLYELSLEYGRKIKLTSSHNVFKYEKGKINLSKTTNLKTGNEIFCPNSLPNSNEIIKEINLLDLINIKKIKDLYISGKDVSQVMKQRVFSKERKKYPNNDLRVIINKFGVQKLKNRREELKLSTKKASEKINLSQPLIVLWENRKRNPSLSSLRMYLKMLNLNSKSFLNKYCKIINSSFNNLLKHVYKNQYKEFSNFNRATLPLHNLKEEEIKKIKSGFIYGSKNKRNKLPIKLELSRELVRLMGYFLAEGDINNNYRIRFSLGLRGYGHEEKIISEIEEFCKKYGLQCNHYIHKKIKHQIITIDNAVLALFFKYIFQFGNRAINKRVPLIIFNLAPELKKEFLRAYFLGDGSISERNIAFNSNSLDLINDLSYLNLQLGIIGGISKTFSKTSKSKNPTWRFTISKDLKKIKKIWEDHHKSSKIKRVKNNIDKRIKLKDISLLKIRDIKKIKTSKKYVYDLSVEGENFIAGQGGVCCHNTDFDIEGEVIGYNIIRFIANREDARRMKFSLLTSDELQNSYDNSLPTIEWGQAIAGETRHFLDWLYGINLSRALMHAISSTGKFKIMSIGRVQGPALHLIVEKEKQIQSFKPTPYWQVFLLVNDGKNKLEVKYVKDITKKQELDKFKDLKNKKATASTIKSKQTIIPPAPFDLTTLQTEAYKFHSINPSNTLRAAQNLYLSGLISYPRTSSQKIPEAMQPQKILKQLAKFHSNLTKHATRAKPVEGSKSDPAHPCFTEDAKISLKDKKITFHDIVKNIRKWEYDKNKKSFHSDIDIKNICTYSHKENLFVYSDAYKIFKTPFNSKMIYFKDIKLKVTPNHPVYSINEQGIRYINAGSLKKGDYILKEDITTKENYRIKISKIDILRSYSKKHQKQINKKTNLVIEKSYSRISNFLEKLTFKKTLVLAKIIGFCMGDGHIHFKKPTKNRENYPLVSFVGKNEDMLKLKMDIEDLGFTGYLKTSKKNSEYSYLISKNSDFGRILISLQCPYGDKVSTKFNIPEWIINSQKEIKSAFIGGLFSAELTKTRIHSKNPRDIRPFTFTQNKEEVFKNSFYKYLNSLKRILKEFEIETSEIKLRGRIIRKKDNEKTIEGSFDIKNNRENLIKFLSKIKLDYCKYKEKSCRKALAYLLYRKIIINKKNKLKEKAKKLYRKGYNYKDISNILNISKYTIKGWVYYKKADKESHISINDIPKFKDFNDEVPERCTPLKIKDIRKIGFRGFVYDLEIKKTHTFFANNILVHNCIMPTGIHQALSGDDEKIYSLIVKRFISCFCDNAELENKKVEVTVNNLKFNARGMEILNSGWMNVYPAKMEEKEIKDMNGEVTIEKVNIAEKQTQPPNRYSPASIIKELEKKSLGTKATRSSIIDTLYNRNYIKGKSIQATELGIRLIDSLEKHSPIIIDEKLTRNFEKDMESIRASKKDLNKKQEKVIKKVEQTLTKISSDFKKQEKEIGKELNEANQAIFEQEKQDNNLHVKCPQCGKGEITIKYTPRFKSYFLACTNYPECKQTFPLPSQSLIKKTDKICEYCRWPMLLRIKQGKKPWIFCPNPKCESKKELKINGNTKEK